MGQIHLQRILHKMLLNALEKESFSSFFILCTVSPSRKYWIIRRNAAPPYIRECVLERLVLRHIQMVTDHILLVMGR